MTRRTRRQFVRDSAAVAAALSAGSRSTATEAAAGFQSRWQATPDRVWVGPEYWTNPL